MKLLFITANRLGDAVLSSGILAALLDTYPDAKLTVACGPLPAPLFATIPQLENLIVLDKRPFSGHWRHLWRQVVPRRWDLVVDLRNSAVSRLIRADKKIIWHQPEERLHKVQELAKLAGFDPAPAPHLWIDPANQEKARALLPVSGQIIALAPGANSFGKKWPIDRYRDLANALTGEHGLLPGARVVLLGDANDRKNAGRLHIDAINLMGEIDLATTAACLQRADLYIGNDSGLTHLAAAAGAPALALFGPGVAWKYRPWGSNADYVSRADDPARDYDLCRQGDDNAALALMLRLEVQEVVAAATRLWQKVHS